MTKFLVPTLALVLLLGANATLPDTEAPKNLLSEYGFFTGRLADMQPYDDEADTWTALAAELDRRGPAYVNLSNQLTIGGAAMPDGFPSAFCKTFTGTLIAAGGFTRETGEQALKDGALDLIAFGKPFIANPDLVERMRNGWPIAEAPREAFYGGNGPRGYTDFPTWHEMKDRAAA